MKTHHAISFFVPVCLILSFSAPALQADGGNYLILAAQNFASSPCLADLADARTARGFNVTIYSVPVGASKESIKTYIQSWYVPGQDAYLLIVGDSDSDADPATAATIPHWTGAATMGAPTDLPYACMDAGDDWIPEIMLGRFAVDNEAELAAIVEKTLFVETAEFPDPDYVKRAALLATSDSSAQAEQTHEAAIAQYLDPAGFESTRIYASEGASTPEIMAAINAGALFTVYIGHSSHSSLWEPEFRNEDLQALTNVDRYGLALAFSCSPAGFNHWYGECLGEHWIREADRGGFAFIGATMLLPMGGDMWEPCRRLEDWFFEAAFTNGIWTVGPLWSAARNKLLTDPDYGPTHPSTRNYFEMFVILGDPAAIIPHEPGLLGDADNDADVDLADFARFQTCFTSPAGEPIAPPCTALDFDGDDLIDDYDFNKFLDSLLGPN